MISIKATSSGDLYGFIENIEKKMPKAVELIGQMIKKDNEENLNTPRSFDGSALKPLSTKYLEWKKKHCSSTDIFKGKELKLIKSVKVRSEGFNKIVIYIDSVRDTIMTYLEESGRWGWGLSKRIEYKSKQIIDEVLSG